MYIQECELSESEDILEKKAVIHFLFYNLYTEKNENMLIIKNCMFE